MISLISLVGILLRIFFIRFTYRFFTFVCFVALSIYIGYWKAFSKLKQCSLHLPGELSTVCFPKYVLNDYFITFKIICYYFYVIRTFSEI